MPAKTGIQSAIMWIWPKCGIRYCNTDFPLPAEIADGYAPLKCGCDQQLLLEVWDIPQNRGCKQQCWVNECVETVTTPLSIPHGQGNRASFFALFRRISRAGLFGMGVSLATWLVRVEDYRSVELTCFSPGFLRPLMGKIAHQLALHKLQ